jgi:hypothetical protein
MDGCVVIGNHNQSYCNVTELWKPSVTHTQVILSITCPTLTALLLIGAAYCLCAGEIRKQDLKEIFYTYKLFIYFEKYAGKELYDSIRSGKVASKSILFVRYPGRNWQTWESLSGEDADPHGSKEELYLHHVSAKRLKHIKTAFTPFYCKCLSFPDSLRMMLVTVSIFVMPTLKLIWDVVDVGVDCLYFAKLERGLLIDENITRNRRVSDAILVFAILGALKTPLLMYGLAKIAERQSIYDNSAGKFLNPLVASIKIIFEDGIEVFLEYFYVDKYVTENQPWLLILKDVVSALIYI